MQILAMLRYCFIFLLKKTLRKIEDSLIGKNKQKLLTNRQKLLENVNPRLLH